MNLQIQDADAVGEILQGLGKIYRNASGRSLRTFQGWFVVGSDAPQTGAGESRSQELTMALESLLGRTLSPMTLSLNIEEISSCFVCEFQESGAGKLLYRIKLLDGMIRMPDVGESETMSDLDQAVMDAPAPYGAQIEKRVRTEVRMYGVVRQTPQEVMPLGRVGTLWQALVA